ncbi:DUF2804 domain-containing protein [Microbacterium sp. STN6]|uniref:DUF2804 domain-containing protein n=1 Tax=Microbacterium sp. STN6 TaxID=2995588 RepID=UPI002260D030|nr:DUF2804 domain-containing protein [Microbacterium sp. STN6]MCX7521812.1 DUF2804 domain-containing protein [Microbacterium sp. STN6]
MSRMVAEREITERVPLCGADGRLNPAAVGWSRHPLIDTSAIGRGRAAWGRNKRWEYWAVTTPTHLLSLTVSSLDYAAVHGVMVHDRRTGETIERGAVAPLGSSATLPASLADGPARARTRSLSIDIEETEAGTRLRAQSEGVSLDVVAARPAGHEALAVVVPWSPRRFQYTVKDVARPATGHVRVGDTEYDVPRGESWAVLDHGRGRWPYRVRWNWGAASGVSDGAVIGLQLGGRWTDGTGSTENAVLVDGRLHKISEQLDWRYDERDWLAPWRILGESLDLRFEPFWDHVSATELVVFGSHGHQCFGHYSGWVATAAGRVDVDGLLGWAEDVRNRW